MDRRAMSFEEFWPEYVKVHQNKLNRTLHVIGTSLALACVLAAVFRRRPWLLPLAPVLAYGFAWCGHFFVEKNMPATFSHPIHSIRADVLMVWKTICGEMEAEVARVLEDTARASEPAPPPVTADAMN